MEGPLLEGRPVKNAAFPISLLPVTLHLYPNATVAVGKYTGKGYASPKPFLYHP